MRPQSQIIKQTKETIQLITGSFFWVKQLDVSVVGGKFTSSNDKKTGSDPPTTLTSSGAWRLRDGMKKLINQI